MSEQLHLIPPPAPRLTGRQQRALDRDEADMLIVTLQEAAPGLLYWKVEA